jgi:hypothetical protein
MATALIQLGTSADVECSAWSTLSGSAVTQIVITASGGASDREARALYNALLATVRRTGARSERTKCGGSFGPGAEGCWAASHPGSVRRILVWVADAALTPPHVSATPSRSRPYDIVFPLLPAGTSANGLPPGIAKAHARWYDPGLIAEKVPDVLVASGLGLDAFRIFISYKHDDCAAVAEQLFDTLSHQQFEVYLDRFRTLPGTNFMERIRFELADKACVLLLDSRNVGASNWVRGEYAFARKYRLGLLAVDLPGGGQTFRRITTRVKLNWPGPEPFDAKTELSPTEIDRAAAFVRQHYATEMARRTRYQRRLILSAGALAGANYTLRSDGNFDVSGGGTSYVVAATARPPSLETMRPICLAAGKAATGVLVGPKLFPSNPVSQDIDWLAKETASAVVDERRLVKAMARMKSGSL